MTYIQHIWTADSCISTRFAVEMEQTFGDVPEHGDELVVNDEDDDETDHDDDHVRQQEFTCDSVAGVSHEVSNVTFGDITCY